MLLVCHNSVADSHIKDFSRLPFLTTMLIVCCMCFHGGYLNGVALGGVYGIGLTHLTGVTTTSANGVVNHRNRLPEVYWYFLFLLAWLVGAFVVGTIIGPARMTWGRRQGLCVIFMGISLLVTWWSASHGVTDDQGRLIESFPFYLGGCGLTFAMGIQNAITSNFKAMTVRTSHVSGTVVDIGLTLGQMLHTRSLEGFWKLKVHVPSYSFFWFGGVVGTVSFNIFGAFGFFFPAIITLIIGIATLVYNTWLLQRRRRKAIEENKQEPIESDSEDESDEDDDEEIQKKGGKNRP